MTKPICIEGARDISAGNDTGCTNKGNGETISIRPIWPNTGDVREEGFGIEEAIV